ITGVMNDVPSNSHFRFDFLASLESRERARSTTWISNSFMTYVRLRPGTDPARVEAQFPALVQKYVGPQIEQALGRSMDQVLASGLRYGFFLQPLTDIHLFSDVDNDIAPQSDIAYVYILSAVAFFILLIACINFMNLATARSAGRAKEVG